MTEGSSVKILIDTVKETTNWRKTKVLGELGSDGLRVGEVAVVVFEGGAVFSSQNLIIVPLRRREVLALRVISAWQTGRLLRPCVT